MGYVKYEVNGTRCFIGRGYSEEHCSQSFDNAEDAFAHIDAEHAAPEYAFVTRITMETVARPDSGDRPS